MRESFVKHYRNVIDRILSAIDIDPEDVARTENLIITKLIAAMRMSKQRGGEVVDPSQTKLYRFANIVLDCKTNEELFNRIKIAFPKHHPQKTLERFCEFNWKIPNEAYEFKETKKVDNLKTIDEILELQLKIEELTEVVNSVKKMYDRHEDLMTKQIPMVLAEFMEEYKKNTQESLDKFKIVDVTKFEKILKNHIHVHGKIYIPFDE
jgi:Ni,Fe-hydrogenase I large subunit